MGVSGPTQGPPSGSHQEHTEGVSGGSPQHKGEWVILHLSLTRQALLRAPGPQDAHTGRSHLRGKWTLVSVPGSGRDEPEAA